ILLFLAFTYVYVYLFIPRLFQDARSALVMGISLLLTLVISIPMGAYLDVAAMPVLLAAMLVVNLLGTQEAYAVNFLLSLILTFVTMKRSDFETSQMLGVLLASSLGGTFVIFLMRRNTTRIFIILDGLIAGCLQLILVGCVKMLSSNYTDDVYQAAAFVIFSSLFSAMLCIGLQSVFESLFNLTTPSKLIELSSPSQPLLKRLMIETPGTYHHSMVVANLAEAAAEAVGANALLCRVGAYYHDIGKLIRPMYFKENQMGENPHDHTDPRVSTAILTEHTLDGVELAKKHHLPEPIIDMIRQHHGDTPVMYFYAKAVQEYGEENVHIGEFRYAGPKPQTAEAGILMMADTVEAAVRSIQEPTHEKISQMIRKLIRGKMEDGQLDDCPLTFRDIGRITFAFETVLQGVFHERIEYPDLNKIRDRTNKKKN
ncbi:MAG: HDIG domain-containing protein, partial [Clostridia bacterium]|nr:HDIG domain-containing protein [Clostridia bacterium]